MSAVKNLRAMFENKGDDPANLPDRGRSPAFGSGHNSPRPLSKIRSNFVAIEKDGKLGLVRQEDYQSHGPSPSPTRWRPTSAMDIEAITSNGPDGELTTRKLFITEPVQESFKSPDIKKANANDVKDKTADKEKPPPPSVSTNTKEKLLNTKKLKSNAATSENKPTLGTNKTTAVAGTAKNSTDTNSKAPNTSRPGARMAAKTAGTATTKIAPTTSKKLDTKTNTNLARSKSAQPTTRKPTTTTAKPVPTDVAPTQTRKPTSQKLAPPSGTGFTKPRPKSPTKPVRLPASLMAPTASSGAKNGTLRESVSRQGLRAQAIPRSSSRISTSAMSSTSAPKTLRKQASTMNISRPSLGLPPKKTQDHPAIKREVPVDESFLARMMRPTQASASKLTEKVPVTPPRKLSHRPSMSTLDSGSRRGSSVKKAISRPSLAAAKSSSPTLDATKPTRLSDVTADETAINTATPHVPEVAEPVIAEAAETASLMDAEVLSESGGAVANDVNVPVQTALAEQTVIEPPKGIESGVVNISQPHCAPVTEKPTADCPEILIDDDATSEGAVVSAETEKESAKMEDPEELDLNLAMSKLELSSGSKNEEASAEPMAIHGDSDTETENLDPSMSKAKTGDVAPISELDSIEGCYSKEG